MEKQLERRREAEPIQMSRVIESLRRGFYEENEKAASLPHVIKYDSVPWLQHAQAYQKFFTAHDSGEFMGGRMTRMPIRTFTVDEQILMSKGAEGAKSGGHRHYVEAIFYIIEGQGYEIHDGVRYDWEAGDFMCVPTYCNHQHANVSGKEARLFFSVTLHLGQFMGLSLIEQMEAHANYRAPDGAQILRGSRGEFLGYKSDDGLELKMGADKVDEARMKERQARSFTEAPRTTYDRYLQTLAEQNRWRANVPHVIKGKEAEWENTRMGRIKQYMSPYQPSPMLFYDAFIQEIPPGGRSGKHRHVAEEVHKILSGRGYDIHDGKRYDWEKEDVVAIPVNTVHQHFNADPRRPAVFVALQSRLFYYAGHGGIEHLEDAPEWDVRGER